MITNAASYILEGKKLKSEDITVEMLIFLQNAEHFLIECSKYYYFSVYI